MSSCAHERAGSHFPQRWKAGLLLTVSFAMAAQTTLPAYAASRTPSAEPRPARAVAPVGVDAREEPKPKKKKRPLSIEEMIHQAFGKVAEQALRIAYCESKFDTDDVSSAGAVGVFQIRPQNHGWRVDHVKDGKDLFDPWTNVRVARHIYDDQGWRPWVCARIVGLNAGSGFVHQMTPTVTTWSPNEGARVPRIPRQPGGTMSTWP